MDHATPGIVTRRQKVQPVGEQSVGYTRTASISRAGARLIASKHTWSVHGPCGRTTSPISEWRSRRSFAAVRAFAAWSFTLHKLKLGDASTRARSLVCSREG